MLRNLPVSVLALLLAAASCARHTIPHAIPPLALTPQARFGLGEGYGPGIVAASARGMRFALAMPAHAIVLRVTEDGVEQVSPTWGHDPAAAPGAYSVRAVGPTSGRPPMSAPVAADFSSDPGSLSCVPVLDPNVPAQPDPSCVSRTVARESRSVRSGAPSSRESDDERGYWLLIVSDTRTPAAELEYRLAQLDFDDTPLLTTVLELPSALIGGRTTNWAAYYVGFGFAVSAPAHSR
jgi:hypothetical protein